ncbi:MvdC/MvdD family ATP grasp protein [Polaromonas sp.]|uniref:MvdC/MvdD family ATP grasp protein n=1 Tax=Polaromonas sp. TaxID=1869339 RepID=UPI003416C4AA
MSRRLKRSRNGSRGKRELRDSAVILVVSYPGEEHTALVVDHLTRTGREVVQIDLADFPARRAIELIWSNTRKPEFLIEHDGRRVNLAEASAVWWRRVANFAVDPSIGYGERSTFAHSETSQAVYGMLDSLSCPWMNPREADAAAHHKPYQWTVAHELGLKVPRTLVTTNAQAAREFIESVRPAKVVFKAFLAAIQEWRETRLIEQEDLDRLELVRYAPVIFQEYVPGVDLRITMIGNDIFAAEIDVRNTSYEVDMRMVVGEGIVNAVTLPDAVQTKLRKLQHRLKLVYGAIDMRRTEAGEYVFLEVNPAGQWLFVEQRTGLPIARALADYLCIVSENHNATQRRGTAAKAYPRTEKSHDSIPAHPG